LPNVLIVLASVLYTPTMCDTPPLEIYEILIATALYTIYIRTGRAWQRKWGNSRGRVMSTFHRDGKGPSRKRISKVITSK
jgi:hypothetical protein